MCFDTNVEWTSIHIYEIIKGYPVYQNNATLLFLHVQ